MMQEVVADDTNGESTFEFVEGSSNPLDIVPASSGENQPTGQYAASTSGFSIPPPPMDPMRTVPAAGNPPLTYPPMTSAQYSSVPPPVALPSFLNPNMDFNVPSASAVPLLQPYYPPASSSLVTTQPSFPPPPPLSSGIPSIYTPMPAQRATALDLPLSDYSAPGYSASMQPSSDAGVPQAGMWGWIKGTVSGNEFLSKVAEKAKSSVDSMITTLDPQMKDYMNSGGDIDLIVASDKEDKIAPIREAFQAVFGRATVSGMATQTNIATQPVGYSSGLKGAEERIAYLRQSGRINERQPVVAIENFLAELTPDRWFDIGCLVLDDPALDSAVQVYTQATPIPLSYIHQIQRDTPADYSLRWSGLSVPIGHVISQSLQVLHTEWHLHLAGVPRRAIILMAAKTLAQTFKTKRDILITPGTPRWQ